MLPILLSTLNEEAPFVRQCAELTLYKWAGTSETVMTALYAAYPTADAGTRTGMIDALYKLWFLREPGKAILRQALKDPDAGVRQAAVRAIATDSMDDIRVLKLPEWLSAIKATLNDPAVSVRLEAVEGLLQLDDNDSTGAEADTLVDRILREGLKQSDAKTRERSARLAIKFTETGGQMTDALYTVVDDLDPLVRDSALAALSRSSANDDPRFTAVCVKALKDAVPWVRVTAVRALARQSVRDAALIPTLLPLLKEEYQELREAALEVITRIADRLALYPHVVKTAELPTSIRTLQEALQQLNAIRKVAEAPPLRPPEALATGARRRMEPPDPPVLFVHLPEAITAVRTAIMRLQGEQIRRAVKKERFQSPAKK
jgi:HEAT repeat protein